MGKSAEGSATGRGAEGARRAEARRAARRADPDHPVADAARAVRVSRWRFARSSPPQEAQLRQQVTVLLVGEKVGAFVFVRRAVRDRNTRRRQALRDRGGGDASRR
jgi:hypothetical protein